MDPHEEEFLSARLERVDGVPEVSLVEALCAGDDARLVDIREPHELDRVGCRIVGMEHIPMDTALSQAHHWNRDEPVLLFCRSGARSGRLARAFEEMGFSAVASVRGGLLAWQDLRLPLHLDEARRQIAAQTQEQ